MRKTIFGLCLLLFAGAALAATPAPQDLGTSRVTPQSIDALRAALKEFTAKVRAQSEHLDIAAARVQIKAIIDDRAFPALGSAERHAALVTYGAILLDAKDYAAALDVARSSSAMPEAVAVDWNVRFTAAYEVEDYEDAALSLTMIARRWPDSLAQYNDRAIAAVAVEIDKKPEDARLLEGVLDALFAANWAPPDPWVDSDWFRTELIRIRVARGDVHGAKDVAARLENPESLIALRSDKRYDALVAADPARFDVAKALDAQLAQLKDRLKDSPRSLEGVNSVGEHLHALKRDAEALAMVDAALAKIKSDPAAFDDPDKINWTLDLRSRLLFALGREDEAFAAEVDGAHRSENGSPNVSQAINLADWYVAYDRPKDALAALAPFDPKIASPYGRMAFEDARACAYFELGDQARLAGSLDYLNAHIADGREPYLDAMLCTGSLDRLASEIIAELDDPAHRNSMLSLVQDYLPDDHLPARAAAMRDAWDGTRRRSDVAAAIAKYGRIASYPLRKPPF